MDFLRRLHPAHADSTAAAWLERAPRWAIGREAGRQAPAAPLAARASAEKTHATPADAGLPPPAMPQPAVTEAVHTHTMAPAAIVDGAPGAPKSVASPTDPRAAPPLGPLQAAPDTSRPPVFERPGPGRETAIAAGRPKPSSAVRPAAAAPLRTQTLQRAQRAAKPDAAPVVHVTIDRIDVRVPAPAESSAPARKPRPASTVAPLADYLRKTRNGAAP
jgi:hypothetical protein